LIVIFANRNDPDAASLAARWTAHNASLLTCDDLSVTGWRFHLGAGQSSTAVVGGHAVAFEEIEGVLIRWPGVFAQELTQIAETDRDYVAAEMMSFMVAWLSSLRCPVVNRPSPVNLTGPPWRHEQWTHAAARRGIPVRPALRRVAFNRDEPAGDRPTGGADVTVVGGRSFGAAEEELHRQARLLAEAAGVSLLRVSFSGPEAGSLFTGADLRPDISSDEVASAVLALLLGERAVIN
jgi:hypothetical protein